MLRIRILVLLGVCFLAGTAAWADDIGYIDCASHADGTQVFGKPRKSNDVVANVACGERFTILVYGFYFSRIQTKDGQVGFVYSNMIAVDRGATSLPQTAPQMQQRPAQPAPQQAPALQMAAEKTKIPRTAPMDAEPAPAAAAQPQAAAPAPSQPASAAVVPTQPATPEIVVEPAPATTSAASSSAASSTAPVAVAAEPAPATSQAVSSVPPAQPQPTAATPDTMVAAPAAPEPAAANPPATAQPEPAAAQPAPEPAQPAQPAPIKPADRIETWEKPRPGVRAAPLLELYGGYSFARFGGASNGTNLNGAMGSFGWNVKSWLQIVADTSYSFQTVGTTKNVIYGNHYGPRYFYRTHNRWHLTPFAEGLVGGSDAKTTVSGTGGYTSSSGATLSYKVGGGLDMHPSRRWDIRLFDVDYYRTSFGTNTHQNNYWISTGVVLRLFGGAE
ncbi:MAG TPA: hypothetical protein VMI32_02955 [Candidatus Solibacter sp.]|nr:hypothetical protein [Candidatus Solibacter sp.]